MCDFFGKLIIREMIVKHEHHCTYTSYTFLCSFVVYYGGHFYYFEEIIMQRKKDMGTLLLLF